MMAISLPYIAIIFEIIFISSLDQDHIFKDKVPEIVLPSDGQTPGPG